MLRPTLQNRSPTLLATHRATAGERGYLEGSPYVTYDALSPDQIKALAVEVGALFEPLGRISGIVTSR